MRSNLHFDRCLDRRSLLLMAAALPGGAAAQGFNHIGPRPALPKVSEALDSVIKQTGVPALGYAAVGPAGVIALDEAGRRRNTVDDYVTLEDPWHIGSNTKAMTAALYARLVEQGKASWGATLKDLFADGQADPAWATVKIEDLLAHRSGISDNGLIDQGWLIKAHADTRPVLVQRAEFAHRVLTHPPTGKYGEFEYANSNYILAGAAIERIYQDSWEVAMGAEVFGPLMMASAGFGAPTGAAPWGHEPGANGSLTAIDPLHDVADNPPVFGPAGRVHVSLGDYSKFVRVFLTGGGGWLAPGSLAKLARPWAGEEGYALGWQYYANKGWADGPVLAHEGSNTLWRTMTLIAPAKPLAYILVTNCGGDDGQRAVQLLAARLIAQQVDPDDPKAAG
jgi:CubicO group peptidase (beta-lactamase class C family)